jgi:kynurenine formamidase
MTIIDLSLLVDNDTQLPIPVRKKLSFDTIKKSPGYWQSTWLSMSAHTATHIDAPLHVCENGARISDIPLDRFGATRWSSTCRAKARRMPGSGGRT